MLNDVYIYTERLKQVSLNKEYFDVIFNNYDKGSEFYMDLFSSGNKEKALEFFDQSISEMEKGTDLHMVLLDKVTEKFIGYVGIYYLDKDDPEIGLWIDKKSTNKGYASEVMRSSIKWLKENCDFTHIRYPVDKKNIYSRRLPEKFGAKIEKEYTMSSCNGRILDLVEYWIVNDK